jgi:hypothetical protein
MIDQLNAAMNEKIQPGPAHYASDDDLMGGETGERPSIIRAPVSV